MKKRIKSTEVRRDWADVLQFVRTGGAVIVEHYNRAIARVIPEDDTLVILRVPNANQAERLRRLVREHGSLGIPFPNNATPGWAVVDEHGNRVNPHTIPNVKVENVATDDDEEPTVTTYTAAIGSHASVVEGEFCDVSVAENVIAGYREDDGGNEVPEYTMGDKITMPAQETTVRTDDTDPWARLEAEAEEILSANGWRVTGPWELSDNAAYAPVELA